MAVLAFASCTGPQLATSPCEYMLVPEGAVLLSVIVSFFVAAVVVAAAVDQMAPVHVVVDAGPVSWQVFGEDG
ncbi:MAG: hypothetical protein JF565_01345 [Propionibacteriales bacterium]|nr:hypothetical protein [Propionibacteriales bacterium]